jgi:glycosyltransferase involved in cell wall biosynthesis
MRIAVHTLVKNEARFVWFAVMSVINHVDRVILWDTGSTDGTVEIIKEIKRIYPQKVSLKLLGSVDIDEFTEVRQKMLEETDEDWFMIVDGDEVWWEGSIVEIKNIILKKGENLDTIVTRNYSVVGDIYHYQSEKSGKYRIGNLYGHLNIRAINRKLPDLRFMKPHGQQGLYSGDGILVQDLAKEKRIVSKGKYMHFTNIRRSLALKGDQDVPKRRGKMKYDLGINFAKDFYYPEVFFRERPEIVPTIWEKRSKSYVLESIALKYPRELKNILIRERVGY